MDRLNVRGGVGRPSMATSASRLSPVPGTAPDRRAVDMPRRVIRSRFVGGDLHAIRQ